MTDLTDKLKTGELEDRFYCVKCPHSSSDEKRLVLVFVGGRQPTGVSFCDLNVNYGLGGSGNDDDNYVRPIFCL